MVKKALDQRINNLLKNGVAKRERSMIVIVGDKGKDQVVNLHWLLSQNRVTARPSVLWCYKKDLGFNSNRKRREQKIKQEVKKGVREVNEEDPFELFISVTNIRYTYYKESHKILGNTYGMCVLQDFEALTPNLLARTIETVEGGGLIVLLLRTMKSLKQLYTMTMDVHSRYRTEAYDDVTNRFNERFILSLGSSSSCLVVDDELNVLPISAAKDLKALPANFTMEESVHESELQQLKESMADTQPIGALLNTAKTLDQAKALLTFVEGISEKTLRSTVTLTAGRGRGKSAALGIAIAAAVAYGYSNIFVTSPHPDNLKTLFQFIFKGFDALNYQEHLDYDLVQSTNPDFNKAIVRVNVFRQHRQTIQYIQPQDYMTLAQAELLVIDEAAAIPLPIVRNLLGPYLVFMASTVNGYEGTGRSLALKLFQQLREQARGFVGKSASTVTTEQGPVVNRTGKLAKSSEVSTTTASGGRSLREIQLNEPIRYAPNDPIEAWLNKLLCLDVTVSKTAQGCPHPDQCQLFVVNRDTLFSYHPVSEAFLQRMMALYVASHYKNTPNDLQLLSDAPAHHLFVLLPPVDQEATVLPDPLCVVQVCLEGKISRQSVLNSLSRGNRAAGDLIPWLVAQQFQDDDFASLSGARVVRIATHPDYVKMGYGARALQLLNDYYSHKITSLNESQIDSTSYNRTPVQMSKNLKEDQLEVRDPTTMPPLLMQLSEVQPPNIHYLGVSYGLTQQLHKFWKRAGYLPLYLRQTPNELTGEHTCVMVSPLSQSDIHTLPEWARTFALDFHKRFLNLLSYQFKTFSSILAISVLEAAASNQLDQPIDLQTLRYEMSPYDLKRLESYANHLLDYHVIMDLVPTLAKYYFLGKLNQVKISGVQSTLLLALGLQHKSFEDISTELNLPVSQLLALFAKSIKKLATHLNSLEKSNIVQLNPSLRPNTGFEKKKELKQGKKDLDEDEHWDPLNQQDLDKDLDEQGLQQLELIRERQKLMLGPEQINKFKLPQLDNENDFATVDPSKFRENPASVISIKSDKKLQGNEKVAEKLAKRGMELETYGGDKKLKQKGNKANKKGGKK